MANTFIKPSVVAKMALANLYANSVMLPLVHRDYSNDYVQGAGDTITIRKPATFTAQDFTSTITVQNITETSVPVVMNYHKDISVSIGAKEAALDLKDFQEQVISPAMEAISQAVDLAILTFRNDITQEVGTAGSTTSGVDGTNSWDADNPRVTIDAKRVLSTRNVPMSDRYVVVGPTTSAKWLGDDLLSKADARGDVQGREDAYLGRKVYGFDPYETQNITGGDTEIGVAFHRTAVAFVTRPLVLPRGAAAAEHISYKGVGMRVVYDYNSTTKQDIMSMDLIFGVKTLDANRACLIWQNAS
jgi:hypothetical protein